MPLVVLEGCDGAGKTTFANQLAEYVKGHGYIPEIWHRGVPKRHPLEEYELDLQIGYPRGVRDRKFIICDRWHLGQPVYGSLIRKEDDKDLGMGGVWHVNALLESLGALQLIFSPPVETMQARVTADGDDYVKADQLPAIDAEYRRLAEMFGIGIIEEFDHHLLGGVMVSVQRMHHQAMLRDFPDSYVGPTYPEIILVGDRSRISTQAAPHLTAFTPYARTSGRYLCETIVNTPLVQRDVGLVTIRDGNIEALADQCNQARVVALGRGADDYLEDRYISHGAVPHPHMIATHHGNAGMAPYADAIMQAAQEHVKVVPEWQSS